MATWKTTHEIEASYLVDADRLVAYGMRGNLSFRREIDGALLFDEAAVARLFRHRDDAGSGKTQGFGVLGGFTLGNVPGPLPAPVSGTRLSGRDARTRAVRTGRDIVLEAKRKAVG